MPDLSDAKIDELYGELEEGLCPVKGRGSAWHGVVERGLAGRSKARHLGGGGLGIPGLPASRLVGI